LKGNLYSCSDDFTIKIWEENKITYKYQSITSIVNNYSIASIYLIYDKNIMITSGENGTIFFNLHNNNYITSIKEAKCDWWNSINRLNEDQIIIGGYDNFIRIISISQKKIISTIDNIYRCHGIYLIKEKGIFLTEENKTIKIYRCDNFKLISNCNYAHEDWIYGFMGLKDGTIASYSRDGVIKIWQF
jgi:WD40 repeat protein